MNKPFAMLLGVASCLGSQSFMNEFLDFEMSLLLLTHRIKFILNGIEEKTPPFSSGFISNGIFEGIIIKKINKK